MFPIFHNIDMPALEVSGVRLSCVCVCIYLSLSLSLSLSLYIYIYILPELCSFHHNFLFFNIGMLISDVVFEIIV
jgi:hypothetical protein